MSERMRIQRKREKATVLPSLQSETFQGDPIGLEHTVNEVPSIVQEVLASTGQSLDADTREFMEPRFGHDFSHVRVHTDERAVESAQVMNAQAYTVGQNVVFGQGQYTPETQAGKHLLAHELTHVVQQESSLHAPASHQMSVSEPQEPHEIEADQIAQAIAGDSMQRIPFASQLHDANQATIHRKPETIPCPGLGSTIGQDNSNVWFNPHADLYIDGKLVQSSWFDPDPIKASFTVSPGTTGKVVVVVDGGYFVQETFGNKGGENRASIEFPFEVKADGTLQWGATSPSGTNPPGSIVQLVLPMVAGTSTSSTGGLISVSPMFSATTSEGHSTGFSGIIGTSKQGSVVANVMRNYQVNLVVPKPDQPTPTSSSQTAYFKPGSAKLDEGQEREILSWYRSLLPEAQKSVESGATEIVLTGRASTTQPGPANRKLAEERVKIVQTILQDFAGSHARFQTFAYGEYEAGTPDNVEDENERIVEMRITMIAQQAPGGASQGGPSH